MYLSVCFEIHIFCGQVNVSSLEEVVKYFMKTATARAEDAQSKADADTVRCTIGQPNVIMYVPYAGVAWLLSGYQA